MQRRRIIATISYFAQADSRKKYVWIFLATLSTEVFAEISRLILASRPITVASVRWFQEGSEKTVKTEPSHIYTT